MSAVNYAYPVSGTVPPTTVQSAGVNMVTATFGFADADTTLSITHNLGLTTTQLANLWPLTHINGLSGGTPTATTNAPALYLVTSTANVTTISKAVTTAGSGGTAICVIHRPMSVIT